jgi:hypothetical protein
LHRQSRSCHRENPAAGSTEEKTDVSIDAQTPTSGRVTAARIIASLGVLGATAAIATLGTFGTFTDTTAPIDTAVDSGVVSIDLAQAGAGLVPFTGGQMLPGDSRTFPVDLVNNGNTALSSVTLGSWATQSSALDSDPVNGLQLQVQSCSSAWTPAGNGYTCAGTTKSFYSGPMVGTARSLTGAASVVAGGVDHLLMTAALPSTATTSSFQGATSTLSFVFTGTQRGGTAR